MLWTPLALAAVTCSSVATALIVYKLWRDWDLRVSSVRCLFFLLFVYLWCYSSARLAFYAWEVALPRTQFVDVVDVHDPLSYDQLDRLGIHAILKLDGRHNAYVTAVLVFGDAAHFGVAIWVLPLAYELSKIVRKSMDRGISGEQAHIRVYVAAGHAAIAVYVALNAAFAIAHDGYTDYNHKCLLFVYCVQIVTLAYMIVLLVLLKVNGRKYETIQGQFVESPVYLRLQRIMVIYAVFALQFQVASLIIYGSEEHDPRLLTGIGASLVLYNLTGLALSITTGCSQICVLRFCGCCIPDDIEAQLIHGGPLALSTPMETPMFFDSNLGDSHDPNPPQANPVFVFTDIESSSALWGMGDGSVMKQASELHDSILRGLLSKYRGYEITTAGDAFQLAFHSIREAVSYCLDAQIQLVMAKWPKELHGMVPATEKKRSGYRLIFNGLRVRMGIHDASSSEGTLVMDLHAVTGKMTYTGASEVIANEVGDLGAGGQILVTRRVAQWLLVNEPLIDIGYSIDRVGSHVIPQVNGHLELFQVCPELLAKRKKCFAPIMKRAQTMYSIYTDGSYNTLTRNTPMTPPTPPYTPMTEAPATPSEDEDYQILDSTRSLASATSTAPMLEPAPRRRQLGSIFSRPNNYEIESSDSVTE
uniref:Guanylate cyclase domain-containing protein n=1 Tax=Globisporangium ultimum (strain ATCC 200006 / CBS 805.95 / DAOM BR144) TaxID=431595 RepID=K3X9B0_GLOUD